MRGRLQNRMMRLRALVGAVTILLTTLAAPVALATQTNDNICAMECCVSDGYCCCNPSKSYVEGQLPESGHQFISAQLLARCPDGCAIPNLSLKVSSGDSDRNGSSRLDLLVLSLQQSPRTVKTRNLFHTPPSSPRAPPA